MTSFSLSEAMTYKAAASLRFGSGKAVHIGDPKSIKPRRLLKQYGRAVDTLDGAYVTVAELSVVAQSTAWVAGLPKEHGGSGDPSPATARGAHGHEGCRRTSEPARRP